MACYFVNAQNAGIGTTSPNTKAQLEIRNTTKDVLMPRMATSQRIAITTPPTALLVYDTDKNEIHQYNGSTWVANLNESVGIDTNASTSVLILINTPELEIMRLYGLLL